MQEELCAASVYAICCMKVTTCFIGNTLCLTSVAPTAVGDNLARKAWEHAYFPSTEKRLCAERKNALWENHFCFPKKKSCSFYHRFFSVSRFLICPVLLTNYLTVSLSCFFVSLLLLSPRPSSSPVLMSVDVFTSGLRCFPH